MEEYTKLASELGSLRYSPFVVLSHQERLEDINEKSKAHHPSLSQPPHTHTSTLLTMSDYPLPPGSYQIVNAEWTDRLVTVGNNNAIDGSEKLWGGVQVWHLEYDDNNQAVFRGSSADVPDGDYIAVNWSSYKLVYSKTPTAFILRRQGGYIVVNAPMPGGGIATWLLPSPSNGTPIDVVPANSNESDAMRWNFVYLSE
ncbi:uncharacterized protein EDB91DRAFT_1137623 [Suillus paluster]|uniref:uncharacterized protein n=1 Tax=Suillus paluster TaxID=48578 RepID=UPI001B875ABE|nr:uncharacterized protein EDB91DRAFT_1137623 [Suillus paluster]KAG1738605.1 hypothetical protein EDB91DRAFT_1137623 [Suillus paluster]